VTYTFGVKSPSTRSLYTILDALYALGLFVAIQIEGNYATASHPEAVLLLTPIVMTVLLFFGQYFVARRELARSRAGHGSGAAPSHAWGVILLAYVVFAWLTVSLTHLDLQSSG
jgi:hypothetical protein